MLTHLFKFHIEKEEQPTSDCVDVFVIGASPTCMILSRGH